MDETVAFTRMADGTREEYEMLARKFETCYRALPDNVLAMLKHLGGDKLGYQVDRLEHSLQTATRAFRDGADEETVTMALLHDIGDSLAPENHAELAAAVLRPYVSEANLWVVQHHGIFQGYYYFHHIGADRNARDKYRGHPHFQRCADFCARWDQVSFDPAYDAMPLAAFEPMVRRLFARKPFAYGN
ncbi:MAG: HD domain-containing protein [Alphaproteobacteria bacterium]